MPEMEEISTHTLTQPWYRRKPMLVLVITYYSVFSFIFLVIFIFENIQVVKYHEVSGFNFLSYCLPNTLLGIGGTLLFLRKKSSLYFFVAMLVVGSVRLLAVGSQPENALFTILPSIQAFALIFGIVIYCLHLNDEGYFN
jgi:hypothetical protein